MSANAVPGKDPASNPGIAKVDMKFEIVVIPVSDVERAKDFYSKLGWRLDADFASGEDFRVIQFTPPGSGCSIIFGKNVTPAAPGSAQGMYLIVSDIEAARKALRDRGVTIGEVFHGAGDKFSGTDQPYLFGRIRVSGPDPNMPATAPSPLSTIRTAMAGSSRSSPRVSPVASTPPRRTSHLQTTWPAPCAALLSLTASMRSASVKPTQTGPTGTPNTW